MQKKGKYSYKKTKKLAIFIVAIFFIALSFASINVVKYGFINNNQVLSSKRLNKNISLDRSSVNINVKDPFIQKKEHSSKGTLTINSKDETEY